MDEKFAEILIKGPLVNITYELLRLLERPTGLTSTPLVSRLEDVPRPRGLDTLHMPSGQKQVAAPMIREVTCRPVSCEPAVLDVKWVKAVAGRRYRITAARKTAEGRVERVVVDDVMAWSSSLLLTGIDGTYHITVAAVAVGVTNCVTMRYLGLCF